MGSMVEVIAMDDSAEFFAPVSSDLIDSLVGQYRDARQRIEALADAVGSEICSGGVMHYFFAFSGRDSRYSAPPLDKLFQKPGAIAALNSAYWSKAMQMTDVLDCMPQARRDEWSKSIREMNTPDFEEETVRATLQSMLSSRQKFFAERVDGIFRALSGEHVTNCPQGFGKRMIIAGVHNLYYSNERCGFINDLRAVIGKFMGRDDAPKWDSTNRVVNAAMRNSGQWMSVDGGALRIRVYLKGTAHLEVHPDMAWRLNCILANLYPRAIPSEFRTKPKRKAKEFSLIQRPLPFYVIEIIGELRRIRHTWRFEFGYSCLNGNKARSKAEAIKVIESIGGSVDRSGIVEFDYDPQPVIDEIITSGCIPDNKSHQFYPTPASLAQRAVEFAEICPNHECLEPSAGTGGLADFMPKDRTTCVEVSELRCAVLESKGYLTHCADFLNTKDAIFDRIVMNPPFDQGRWQAHIEHASTLIRDNGRIVAILPSGAKNSASLPCFSMTWHGPFDNQFPGASVSVVILVAERQA